MSKFRPSLSGVKVPRQPLRIAAVTAPAVPLRLPQAPAARPVSRPPAETDLAPNSVQRVAFVMLCIYLVANLANDWTMRYFGSRAYLTLIAGGALPLLCLGTILNGLRTSIGRAWAFFMMWMTLCVATSTWISGSFGTWQEFATKNYPIFFYCAATVVNLTQMRTLFRTIISGGVVVIISCVIFGDGSSGRLQIPGSIFFDNSNDLALQLLISAGFFLFLVMSKNGFVKFLGAVLVAVALMFMLQTGSRANFLSLVVAGIAALALVRRKGALLAGLVGVALLAAVSVPAQQWKRLVYLVISEEEQKSAGNLQNGDFQSQMQRTEMFKASLRFTAESPLFGVGPGQFPDQVWSRAKMDGKRLPSLGTHNTYTQISSELGIPALLFYLIALTGCFRLMYRLYKLTRDRPEWDEISNMSLCMLLVLVVFSFSTIFHHAAYSRHFATLAGMSVCLYAAAMRRIQPPTPLASRAATPVHGLQVQVGR